MPLAVSYAEIGFGRVTLVESWVMHGLEITD
ncbi:MAG: hypothetical protein ACI9JR_002677, partial [Gammaproteobacteria bacterium]